MHTHQNNYNTIGIIGGVGPIATVDFFHKLLQQVHAEKDQDYPRIIIDSDPSIPDRTRALIGEGENPTEHIIRIAHNLQSAGANVLCIPCNTAHAFFEDIQDHVDIPIVNMIEAVCNEITDTMPKVKNVGILATTGTRSSRLYDNALLKRKMNAIHVPDDAQKNLVMTAIYGENGIKAGNVEAPKLLLQQAIDILIQHGAEVIILACTELPLVIKEAPVPIIDSTMVLAKQTLDTAYSA